MRLHMLPLERQIQADRLNRCFKDAFRGHQVLLKIEREIELRWCDLMSKLDGREERSAKLREFLDFPERLRPFARGNKQVKDLSKGDIRKELLRSFRRPYLNEEDLMPGAPRDSICPETGRKPLELESGQRCAENM